MKPEIVYWSVGDLPLNTRPLTAVIGNFDGVHLGHQKLISTAKELAFTIHQDIGNGFLHAIDAKTKQRIGADHELKNNDIIKIVSTLSRG